MIKGWSWKKGLTVTLAGLLTVAVAGCGEKKDAAGGAEATAAPKKVEELTVLLDWYPNAVHSFLFAAQKEGYFEEAGLKVKLETPAGTDDALKLLAAGKADLALSYQPVVAIARSEDIPVVSVAAIVRHPLNRLFALEESGIKSPKDLEGKNVGYPSIPMDESMIITMTEKDGGDPTKVKFTDIGWDLIPALSTKKVDAIIGGYVNHEKLLMEKEGLKIVTIEPAQYGIPDYYELILTASEKGLQNKSELFKKFIEAAAKGQEYTVNHPQESLNYLLEQQNKDFPLDPEVEKMSLEILLPLMDDGKDKAGFGVQTEESWKAIFDWLKSTNQIKGEPAPKDAFRNL